MRCFPNESMYMLIEKAVWGSPGGKRTLAKRIVSAIPSHSRYVEPFVGSGGVFFQKEPSEEEVLSDVDPDIAFAFRFVRDITPGQLANLRRMSWIGSRSMFFKLKEAKFKDPVRRFHRFAYLSYFSYFCDRTSFSPSSVPGRAQNVVDRVERYSPRLKGVSIRCADYAKIVRELDGKDTFFFLDPPYVGYDAQNSKFHNAPPFEEARFIACLKRIRGRFLCTYGTRSDSDAFRGFQMTRWYHTQAGSHGDQSSKPTLIITNYSL